MSPLDWDVSLPPLFYLNELRRQQEVTCKSSSKRHHKVTEESCSCWERNDPMSNVDVQALRRATSGPGSSICPPWQSTRRRDHNSGESAFVRAIDTSAANDRNRKGLHRW